VSFGSPFRSFCDHYSIDLSDLWPVVDASHGVSLSAIRNRLVHGEAFAGDKYSALITAEMHLQWTVERMLLGALGWPVSRSAVDAGFLSAINQYYGWQTDRRNLSLRAASSDVEGRAQSE
jgi:hypothetical protein